MVFELDRAGGAEVLKELATQAITDLANQVAAKAGPDAIVEMSITDRAKAKVKVPAAAQAKDGLLSRAASEVGLEVKPLKKQYPIKKKPAETVPAKKRGRPRKSDTSKKSKP